MQIPLSLFINQVQRFLLLEFLRPSDLLNISQFQYIVISGDEAKISADESGDASVSACSDATDGEGSTGSGDEGTSSEDESELESSIDSSSSEYSEGYVGMQIHFSFVHQ